jgi:hypothetical protein
MSASSRRARFAAALLGVAAWLTGARLPAQDAPLEALLAPASRADEALEGDPRQEWETDRDSFTPSTKTAGRRRLIVESAYSFLDNRGRPETHSFPEFLARYGVGERAELRLGWNYEVGGGSSGVSSGSSGEALFGEGLRRETNVNFGAKFGVTEQNGWVPESAVIFMAFTPTSGEETATQFVATYAFGWEFADRWKLDSAMRFGADSEGGDRFEEWAPSVVLKVPVGERWDAHVEYFGIFSGNKAQDFSVHYFSPGLHYLLTENVEVGARLGWGLNDQAARFFVNAGVGVRF